MEPPPRGLAFSVPIYSPYDQSSWGLPSRVVTLAGPGELVLGNANSSIKRSPPRS